MERLFGYALAHRAWVWGVVCVLTGMACVSLLRAEMGSSLKSMYFGDSAEYAAFEDLPFGSGEVVVLAYADTTPLSDASFDRLERAVETLRWEPEVAGVTSLLDAFRVEPEGLQTTPWRQIEDRAGLAADPAWHGVLLNRQEGLAAIAVELRQDPSRPAEDLPELVDRLRQNVVDAGWPVVYADGVPVMMAELTKETERTLLRVLPTCALACLVVAGLWTRSLFPVFTAALVGGISVLWTLGLAAALDSQLNVLTAMAMPVVLVIALSDVVHLYSAWRAEVSAGVGARDAALRSVSDVGPACLLTSITTFVGFASLALVPSPGFRMLGVVLGFGTASALVLAVALVPTLLVSAPASGRGVRPVPAWLTTLWSRSARFPGRTALVWSLLLAGSVVGLGRMNLDADPAGRFAEHHRYHHDHTVLTEDLPAANTVDLIVSAPDVLDPAVLRSVGRFQAQLDDHVGVEGSRSLVDHLTELHTQLGGDGVLDRAAAAQLLLVLENASPELSQSLVDFERQRLRVPIRVHVDGMRGLGALADRLEVSAAAIVPGDVSITGLYALLGRYTESWLAAQKRGLALTIGVVSFGLIAAFGWRLGLVAAVANLLPLTVLGGVAGWAYDPVDTDLFLVALMAIGIGVDDTIHVLYRFRLERRRGEGALERTLHAAGRGVLLTTILLLAGFLPFASSGFLTVQQLGTLLPVALLTALVADMTLLPAMIRLVEKPACAGGIAVMGVPDLMGRGRHHSRGVTT